MKLKKYIFLIILLLLAAINFNLFLKPLNLVVGGTQGLAIILNKLIHINHATLILIINIIMLILSYIFLSKKTTLGTIIATLIYPLFIRLTNNLNFSFNSIYLNILITGIISGTTNGLIYKLGFTAGGINILGPLINKYKKIKIGTINMLINSLILFFGCLKFGITKCFYSLIVIGINSLIINLIIYKKKKR